METSIIASVPHPPCFVRKARVACQGPAGGSIEVDDAAAVGDSVDRAQLIATALTVIAYPPPMVASSGIPVRCVAFSNSRDLDSLTAISRGSRPRRSAGARWLSVHEAST